MSDSDEQSEQEFSSPITGDGVDTPFTARGISDKTSVPRIKEIGVTPLARQLGLSEEQTNGHWCSRCQGIWYGYTLETECPACGNRRG